MNRRNLFYTALIIVMILCACCAWASAEADDYTPEELSAAHYSFTLDGTEYRLPCSLKVFTDNGWTVTDLSVESIPATTYVSAYLQKDDLAVRINLTNFLPVEAPASTATVTMLEGDSSSKLALPCGATPGMSFGEFVEKLGIEIEDTDDKYILRYAGASQASGRTDPSYYPSQTQFSWWTEVSEDSEDAELLASFYCDNDLAFFFDKPFNEDGCMLTGINLTMSYPTAEDIASIKSIDASALAAE